ncbi:hypothetical protein F5880DRAFT_1580736 [Lentinula raphanica]|nr:hypothetical protein F5880DRAFT_1580736 [Lentinula raphanica]
MRLGIFRRFSYLIHRRTRSDSALLTQPAHSPAPLPSSLSLDGLPRRDGPSAEHVLDTILPTISPLMPIHVPTHTDQSILRSTAQSSAAPVERSSLEALAKSTENNLDDPILRLSTAREHAEELAAQSAQLKESLEALHIQSDSVKQAIIKAKTDLELARSLANSQKRKSADLELQVNAKRHELAQCEALAKALSDTELVSLAAMAKNTTDFEESAVEAISNAASNEASVWSKIVQLVVGPRAPENYVNAVNMTLQARQELRYWKKVSNFWKKTARESSTNTGAPTPSASNLSEIQESLSIERKKAVEDLREKRKTLGLNNNRNISPSVSSSNDSAELAYRLPDSHPSFTSVMSTISNLQSGDSSTAQSSNRLPPLASDMFKQDLLSSHSSQRLFTTSSYKSLWSPPTVRQAQMTSKPSDKSLGKRKEIVIDSVDSIPSFNSSSNSNTSQIASSAVASSSGQLSSWASFSSDIDKAPPSRLSTTSSNASNAFQPVHHSLQSAERALESFERICNRFSSGSNVGSLQSISEESSLSNAAGVDHGPQIVVHIPEELSSESLSSTSSSSAISREDPELVRPLGSLSNLKRVSEGPFEGDTTLVESGSNQGFAVGQENDTTLIDVEPSSKAKDEIKDFVKNDVHQEPSPMKRTRLPIFKIPDRLSQISRMTGSSSKKSLSSFQSRNSSNTISTVASREITGPRSVKKFLGGIPALKPVLPLRIVKKGKVV